MSKTPQGLWLGKPIRLMLVRRCVHNALCPVAIPPSLLYPTERYLRFL